MNKNNFLNIVKFILVVSGVIIISSYDVYAVDVTAGQGEIPLTSVVPTTPATTTMPATTTTPATTTMPVTPTTPATTTLPVTPTTPATTTAPATSTSALPATAIEQSMPSSASQVVISDGGSTGGTAPTTGNLSSTSKASSSFGDTEKKKATGSRRNTKKENKKNKKKNSGITLVGNDEVSGVLSENEAADDSYLLVLVNKQNPVPKDYTARLTYVSGYQVRKEVAAPLTRMISDARKDGVSLVICSAYRSYDRQTTLFNNKINTLLKSGMSYLDAYRVGSYSVTLPGTSEHQLGMALDIVTNGYSSLDAGFSGTKAGKWLAKNSSKYGFILRYPKNKEHITGITFEPWHFRYVGVENAKAITEAGICLEEYVKEMKLYER